LGWDRAHPEIPTLLSGDGLTLPGSQAQYVQRDQGDTWEIADSLALHRGGHVITLGGSLFLLRSDSRLAVNRDGAFFFNDRGSFFVDAPSFAIFSTNRAELPRLVLPRPDREYWNSQFSGFLQDSFKLGARVGLSLGVRYESFGSPQNRSVQDGYLRLGQGASIEERLVGASMVWDDPQHHRAYRPDRNDWAARVGVSYDADGQGTTVLRGAYGIFYDRPFDNLTRNTRNNNFAFVLLSLPGLPDDYLRQTLELQRPRATDVAVTDFPELVWVDHGLRTPYSQNWFAGIEQKVSSNLSIQASFLGASARKIIATDFVNRLFSQERSLTNLGGRFNSKLGEIVYRSNFGSSSYAALGTLARYRSALGHQFQFSYTLGRAVDNQSDPLAGQAFTLATQTFAARNQPSILATLTRQFDSSADRGYSDFHQRHNVVVHSIWELGQLRWSGRLGRLLHGWEFAQLASVRSGFPYTVYVGDQRDGLLRNRPNLVPGKRPALEYPRPSLGGQVILDRSALAVPAPGAVGDLKRNSLVGPGFWNVDASLAKSFAIHVFGGEPRLQLRVDFFNLFNHTNLGNPDTVYDSNSFGVTLYGEGTRASSSTKLGVTGPLSELSRQVQLQLKLFF